MVIAPPSRTRTSPMFPDAVLKEASRPPFRFVDLFAGIGGIRMGLESAGGRCVYTVEIDRFAVQTYEANFGHVEAGDIRGVPVEAIPDYEVLAGGFPCQPFSLAGVSKKLSLGRQHGFGDEKSGNLFFEIVRLIDDAPTPPPVLFLENVKHLTRHDQGRTFGVIHNTLEDRGYNLAWRVVDAKPWVPQHRERTYIVGLHRDVYGEQTFDFPDTPEDSAYPTLDSVLEVDSVPDRYVLSDHLWNYLQEYARKHREKGNGFGYGLVGRDDTARTLSARYHKDGSEILIETGGPTPRRLTPRECARLMGYPEDFVIPVSDTQAYRQFGNSVVVPVIKHLAKALAAQVRLRRAPQKA
jgi:DNA (cytosine-5)-methyltransferase 1